MKKTIKTITLFLLVIAMLIPLIGCGKQENEVFYTGSITDTSNLQNNVNGNNSISNGSVIANSNNELSKYFNNLKVSIREADDFSDGVAWIKIGITYEKEWSERQILIDTAGKILFDMPVTSKTEFLPYKNGVSVKVKDSVCEAVYDKEGNVVISSEKQCFDDIIAFSEDNRYFIVNKIEESFSGDVYMVGVIDNTGKYIQELSASHPIAAVGQKNMEKIEYLNVEYLKDDIFHIDGDYFYFPSSYYHSERNIITVNYEHVDWSISGKKYDEDGNSTDFFEEINLDDVVDIFDDYSALVIDNDGKFLLYDYNGNLIMDFGSYNLGYETIAFVAKDGLSYYFNGYFLTKVKNSTGGDYCCLFDPEQKLVFEPIRMNDGDTFHALNNKGFVFETKSGKYTFYQCDGTTRKLKYGSGKLWQERDIIFEYGAEQIVVNNEWVYINENEETVISGYILKENNQSYFLGY